MNINNKALELTKRFALGAPCAIDLSPEKIKFTVFWPHYERIAREMKAKEVDENVVKKYWFEIHNELVCLEFQAMKKLQKDKPVDPEEYGNCMVHPEKRDGEKFCVHGGIEVCAITKEEFDYLEEQFQEKKKGLI